MSVEFEGAEEMQRTLRRIADSVPDQAEDALKQEAEVLAAQARDRAPVLTGALKDSIRVGKTTRSGGDISVPIIAGGPSAPHAAAVHEDLDAQHSNGQAKFLEQPVMEAAGSLVRKLGNRIKLK